MDFQFDLFSGVAEKVSEAFSLLGLKRPVVVKDALQSSSLRAADYHEPKHQ